jgi:hypothetical protein
MSIVSRVRKTASVSPLKKNEEPIIVFESVRDLLENHPIVHALNVDVQEVHSALLEYHKRMCTNPKDKVDTSLTKKPNCQECGKGYLLLDHVDGCELCDYCGLVSSMNLNFIPDYDNAKNDRLHKQGDVVGVSPWMLFKENDYNDDVFIMKRELEHWNHYSNLSDDELELVACNLKDWCNMSIVHSQNAKMAAVLLYNTVKDKVPESTTVRSHVRHASYRHVLGKRANLEIVETAVKPQFFCATCNAGLYDKKSAVWHCRKTLGRRNKQARRQ